MDKAEEMVVDEAEVVEDLAEEEGHAGKTQNSTVGHTGHVPTQARSVNSPKKVTNGKPLLRIKWEAALTFATQLTKNDIQD